MIRRNKYTRKRFNKLIKKIKYIYKKTVKKNNKIKRGGWDKNDETYQKFVEINGRNPREFENNHKEKYELVKNETTNKANQIEPSITSIYDLQKYIKENDNEIVNNLIEEFKDDGNYNDPKYTIIPKGTIFYRRQKTEDFKKNFKEIWLDYSGFIGNKPFMTEYNDEYTQIYYNRTKKTFGKFLMKFETNCNLLIFNYEKDVKSGSEGIIRNSCSRGTTGVCPDYIDGYTLDFLEYNSNEPYADLPILEGYRELCLLNNKYVDFLEIVNKKWYRKFF